MPDVETAAETARAWVSWGQAAGLGKVHAALQLQAVLGCCCGSSSCKIAHRSMHSPEPACIQHVPNSNLGCFSAAVAAIAGGTAIGAAITSKALDEVCGGEEGGQQQDA